jgi:large subunit ribosomal protein L24
MIRNPQSGKPERIGYKLLADGRKVRFMKSNSEVLDV